MKIEEWLDENAETKTKKEVIKFMIKFKIKDDEAEKIYKQWRRDYMKLKYID